jgi:preprotein translocase subunit SecF
MFIIKHKNIFLGMSAFFVVASFISIFVYGIRTGIDFTGGSLIEIAYSPVSNPEGLTVTPLSNATSTSATTTLATATGTAAVTVAKNTETRPDVASIKEAIKNAGFKDEIIQPTGSDGYIIRMKNLTDAEHQKILSALSLDGSSTVTEKRFTSIGPIMGNELRTKAIWATVGVILAIMLFIAFAFRKVSVPVSSSRYGYAAVVALVHDVIIPMGAVAVLGHFYGFEVDVLFVTAILIILGFSVHDTIVVFDRIRENLKNKLSTDFEFVVGKSLEQTFVRSLNTSMSVIFVLLMLVFIGPSSTFNFSLILLIGITMGTYSSIFLASPLLVVVEEWQRKGKPVAAPVQTFKKKGKKQ